MKLSWDGFKEAEPLPSLSKRMEDMGFDTVAAIEARHDPFVQAATMVEHTRRVEVWHAFTQSGELHNSPSWAGGVRWRPHR